MDRHEGIEMRDVLEFALEMGQILLKNGAEIFRVEETIEHICKHYDISSVDTFILSNGIFITAEKNGDEIFAKVKHVPLSGTHLGIVDAVNDLSREICAGNVSLEDAAVQLEEIEKIPPKKDYFRIWAAGLGSACFCYLLGGGFGDSLLTLLVGAILYRFVIWAGKHNISKILVNIAGGGLITVLAICATYLPGTENLSLNRMIIGCILPLVPGVAFVNAIRDVASSNFISGIVRMIDALLVFVYIAIGVGTALSIVNSVIGGVRL